ncbi:B12-binding domain-containing radical SAM protein [Entomomonas sp. E2T0]|uniref:B12-binding domain-containing radical SAM protein n=1 Tax=Entomomonas sp. E2T0 TaxID=2930213 RepID=UPI0022282E27|nr:radical SAM protein [Entomomonas sp. E2T0]UYZ84788.1 B12-binding domain-containing radical SAM protein [Entomomonas sp. E2T0]
MSILLTTLNARFAHASLALRYLYANMHELQQQTEIVEFTIQQNVEDILEKIIEKQPTIIGFSVYIWNIIETTQLIKELKILRPEITVIIGGPEVSYEYENTEIYQTADYLIKGWGDISFYQLCHKLLNQQIIPEKAIQGIQEKLENIILPYDYYTDHDIKHRTVYVEASRGCPFKCEFCLSSLDKTAWTFPLEPFLQEMDKLYQRGLRQFKFIDRTFNLKKEFTTCILKYFLDKITNNPNDPLFLHFELVPDHLPDELKELILLFPEGSLQFEIGIQTLNPTTQALISRKTNLQKAQENIRWLSTKTTVHLHVDLIAGLPDETLEEFGKGFNELWAWQPQEIQLGILKRLKGTPIIRHTETYNYKYSLTPPYSVLENKDMRFETLNHIKRIAKFWDLIANSGRFKNTLPLLLRDDAFNAISDFSYWAFPKVNQTHGIALDKLLALVFDYLNEHTDHSLETIQQAMQQDFIRIGTHGWPRFLGDPPENWKEHLINKTKQKTLPKRQQQHSNG